MGTQALLGGRYRLDSVAGHGGMATVFSAHDTVLDRKVAIKILQRRRDETGVLHERFELDHTTLQVDHTGGELLEIEPVRGSRGGD